MVIDKESSEDFPMFWNPTRTQLVNLSKKYRKESAYSVSEDMSLRGLYVYATDDLVFWPAYLGIHWDGQDAIGETTKTTLQVYVQLNDDGTSTISTWSIETNDYDIKPKYKRLWKIVKGLKKTRTEGFAQSTGYILE